jgi:hypothetical protein
MRVRIAVGAALVLLAAAVVALLSTGGSTLAYDNGRAIQIGAVVAPGGRLCEGGQYVPPGATRLRVWISTAGRPGSPLRASVVEGSQVVARGAAPGGYRDEPVDVKLTKVPREIPDAAVCIRNRGPRRIALMGDFPGPGEHPPKRLSTVTRNLLTLKQQPAVVTPPARQPSVVVRFEWHTPPVGSWWSLAPAIADRAGLGKASFIGSWTLWLAAALMVGVAAAAAWAVTREGDA